MKLGTFRGLTNGAYDEAGEALKASFLRAGAKFLRAAGKALAAKGFTEVEVHSNRGGVAVSGEVYGYFFRPGERVGAMVEVGTSCLSFPFCRMTDHVCVRYVWRCRREQGCHTPEGGNQWMHVEDDAFDSDELARVVAREVEAGQRRMSVPA